MSRPLMGFYGDDFTGSTDAMEALAMQGFRTVLFLEPPDAEQLKRFDGLQCFGVAGTARAKTNEAMRDELVPVFAGMKQVNPLYVHYKTCSTFDSSPEIGSIGMAMDLAGEYFREQKYPILAGVPQLGRYTVFGHHFARMGQKVYRLDRHPVMSRHPVTPMDEADLIRHLSRQTKLQVKSVTIQALRGQQLPETILKDIERSDCDAFLFDVLDENDMHQIADILWAMKQADSRFIVGSSGVEYALGRKWKQEGMDNSASPVYRSGWEIDQILVVSGSVSEITAGQMKQAYEKGFHLERIPYQAFGLQVLPVEFLNKVKKLLAEKKKVLLYASNGPDDETINKTIRHFEKLGIKGQKAGQTIGQDLGRWTRQLIKECSLKRVILAGGDTSGFIARELGIYALEMIAPVSPGAPLCKAYGEDSQLNGIEIAFKGGQLGGEDYFHKVFST